MKKTKTKAVKKQAIKTQSKNLPAGYTDVGDASMAPAVDWKKTKVVEGVVVLMKTIEKTVKEKGKNVVKKMRLMVIENDKGRLAVWEKKALEGLFNEAAEGSEVYIRHTGRIKIKGRPEPMHTFDVGMK